MMTAKHLIATVVASLGVTTEFQFREKMSARRHLKRNLNVFL